MIRVTASTIVQPQHAAAAPTRFPAPASVQGAQRIG